MPRLTIAEHGIRVDIESDGPGATRAEIDAYLEASSGGFTTEQLREAFGMVQDSEHWKNPIDRIVERSMVEVLDRAIPFMTGTPASFEDVPGEPGRVRVTADGYFAGPCN